MDSMESKEEEEVSNNLLSIHTNNILFKILILGINEKVLPFLWSLKRVNLIFGELFQQSVGSSSEDNRRQNMKKDTATQKHSLHTYREKNPMADGMWVVKET